MKNLSSRRVQDANEHLIAIFLQSYVCICTRPETRPDSVGLALKKAEGVRRTPKPNLPHQPIQLGVFEYRVSFERLPEERSPEHSQVSQYAKALHAKNKFLFRRCKTSMNLLYSIGMQCSFALMGNLHLKHLHGDLFKGAVKLKVLQP